MDINRFNDISDVADRSEEVGPYTYVWVDDDFDSEHT